MRVACGHKCLYRRFPIESSRQATATIRRRQRRSPKVPIACLDAVDCLALGHASMPRQTTTPRRTSALGRQVQPFRQPVLLYSEANVGRARRDEHAKKRLLSFRSAQHGWGPRLQRTELWRLYKEESMRIFSLSNWTERDVRGQFRTESTAAPSLYFAAFRSGVRRDDAWIMVDDERPPLETGEQPQMPRGRFRTLGCYPLTGAIDSYTANIEAFAAGMAKRRSPRPRRRA